MGAYHRDHAVIELNIKDLKENVGLNHMPSGKFNANGAWLIIASIAYNMMIWINLLTNQTKITAKTFRKRFINIAGRITRKARTLIVHLPYKWPFQKQWFDILDEIQLLTIKT